MTTFTASTTLDIPRPAATVWTTVADYDCDPQWREGVVTMAPSPAGIVEVGTTTAEELHLAGAVWHNRGVVDSVDAGRAFTWHTVEGAEARGRRVVDALDPGACRLTLEITVTLDPSLAAMADDLHRLLQATQDGDAARLRQLLSDRSEDLLLS